jgi:hypothetical protein
MFKCAPCAPSVPLVGAQLKPAWLLGWGGIVPPVPLFFSFSFFHPDLPPFPSHDDLGAQGAQSAANPRQHWARAVPLRGAQRGHKGHRANTWLREVGK